MQQYKFRGKRIDNDEWIYGSYHKHIKRQISPVGDKLTENDIQHLIIINGFADWNMPRPIKCYKVDPDTVGQFTGLRDDNDNEVYTGDLCKLSSDSFYSNSYVSLDEPWELKVEIIDYGYAYAMRATEDEDLIILLVETYWEDFDIKVVGNRWDNPEVEV